MQKFLDCTQAREDFGNDIYGRLVTQCPCNDKHSTGRDSNCFTAERRRFYAFLRGAIFWKMQGCTLGEFSVLWRAIGGIWRAAPGDDENYVSSIAL